MKQFLKELSVFFLLLISLLWILATAGASDAELLTVGQCTWRLAIGAAGLLIAAWLLDRLAEKKGSNE